MSPKLQRLTPIAPSEGDIYNGDLLNRRPDCEYLRDGILTAKTPCVLAVNASWGAGKTTFLQMLQEECKVAEMRSVYFDAWKNDFHSDALAPMIGEINRQLAPKGEFKQSILAVGHALKNPETYTRGIDLMMNILGKAEPTTTAVESGVEMPKADDLRKFVQKMSAKSNAIVEYAEREKAMDKFREELKKFANLQTGKPFVFFVDELDRCRPIFAVEVLEKIKHVFDVSGVFFVIAVNKDELQKTIKSVYGDINSALYLRRFFDYEFALESQGDVVTTALNRCQAQASASSMVDGPALYNYLSLLCRDFGLPPRDQEQVAALAASALSVAEGAYFDSILYALFVVLKFDNPALYAECLNTARWNLSDFSFEKVMNYYELKTGAYSNIERSSRDRVDHFPSQGHPHYFPIRYLSVMRYLSDGSYKQIVDARAGEEQAKRAKEGNIDSGRTFWEDVMVESTHPPPYEGLQATFENIEFGAKKQQ